MSADYLSVGLIITSFKSKPTSQRLLDRIVMANPALVVQQAILRKGQSFPILNHAVSATPLLCTAIRLI